VAGRDLEAQTLPPEHDPWLVIRQPGAGSGGARKLALNGSPAVPERLDLTGPPGLTGWLATYYEEALTGPNAAWERKGDEIVGRRFDEEAGAKLESVLQYHRPLIEDGVVEYEFFHEPGKTTVHPALDRLTFLLEPAGVRVHWMTDAAYERTGLALDNAAVEKANRRGPDRLPLKPGEWNRLRLTLKGDAVTLHLNGVEVYERALEPGNQRVFGLFRYADETAARVRKVGYAGGWAKAVPAGKDWLAR
jgi:hypothetical protein